MAKLVETVETLTVAALNDNVALSKSVGWNDAAGDWRVLHRAALVLGVRQQNRLVAQGALGCYGNCGTIAKMIVAPSYQRKGTGRRVLAALLDAASDRSLSPLGLTATPSGRGLYQAHGFEEVGEVVTLIGEPARATTAGGAPEHDEGQLHSSCRIQPLKSGATALSLDAQWLGCSRELMLQARYAEARAALQATDGDGTPIGFALVTHQGSLSLVGPVIAATEESARSLVGAIMQAQLGALRIDVPDEQDSFRRWLVGAGFKEVTIHTEMSLGAQRLPWQVPERFALAAQAWG